MKPLVSICIPTYRQTHLLKENLDAICEQTCQNIEVLVSDDSPGEEVKKLIEEYTKRLPISYVQNNPSLGSPANWNAVLKRAKGKYVILLHHDDQFTHKDSLATMLAPLQKDSSLSFCFGRNEGIDKIMAEKPVSNSFFKKYRSNPTLLIKGNVVGAPSNVCLRRKDQSFYDERFKWIVDIEWYTRLIHTNHSFVYIDKYLVKTGRHDLQVTNECVSNHELLLYENLTYAAENISTHKLDLTVYDFYWRLIRNADIRELSELEKIGFAYSAIPSFIRKIIATQSKIPRMVLSWGPASKLFMSFTYVLAR